MKDNKSVSLEELFKYRKELFKKADKLVADKGHDYNNSQQKSGDTLFNIKTCEILGIVPIAERGILIRISDKLMRLVSLVNQNILPKNKDEKVEDTIVDAINYLTYLGILWRKRNE